MKLSEAIRTGATLHAGCKDDYVRYEDAFNDSAIRTCAMGAAFEAITGKVPFDSLRPHELLGCPYERAYAIYHENFGCDPVCMVVQEACGLDEDDYIEMPDGTQRSWVSAVVHMNDTLGWEREAIADYLAERGF